MSETRLTFGKHKGMAVELVPVEYLTWSVEKMAKPPKIVLDELKRRAQQPESKDGMLAQAALSSMAFKRPKKARKGEQGYWDAKLREHSKPRRRRRRHAR